MRIIHISDLHLGKQLFRYNLAQDQQYVLQQVVDYMKQDPPEALVIAGDVYDKPIPSAQAVTMFNDFLMQVTENCPQTEVLMIAGNHDSGERLDFASGILQKEHIHIAGMPPQTPEDYIHKVTIEDAFGPVHFYLLPFMKPGHVKEIFGERPNSYDEAVHRMVEREAIVMEDRNVFVSHQFYIRENHSVERSESEVIMVGDIDSVDVACLSSFDYIALGHIHSAQKVGRDQCRYTGTLMPYSVSEGQKEHTFTEVVLEEKGTTPKLFMHPVKLLHRVKALKGSFMELRAMAAEYGRDFVSLTVTDDDIPVDLKESLAAVYEQILEIKVENHMTEQILSECKVDVVTTDPFTVFSQFFYELQGREMSAEESSIMTDIMNHAKESDAYEA